MPQGQCYVSRQGALNTAVPERAAQLVMVVGCQWVCSGSTTEQSKDLVGCIWYIAGSDFPVLLMTPKTLSIGIGGGSMPHIQSSTQLQTSGRVHCVLQAFVT